MIIIKKKVVVYTRVSTNKEEQKSSLAIQKEYYKQYCAEKGYKLTEDGTEGIYADVGSATSVRSRPDFIKMLHDAGLDYERNNAGTDIFRLSNRNPKFDMIIVKDASRFSRNQEIGVATVKQLRSKNVSVLFENAGVSSDDDNANLMLPILFTIAENESENMSKKITFSKRFNSEQQKYSPARLPFGYIRDDNKNIIIHEEQAEVVRYIHNNYAEHGGHTIAIMLNDKGITTQQGKKWSNEKIGRIILQTIYHGTATVHKTKKIQVTDTERVDVPKKEWVTIPDAVPAIITKEQFDFNNKIRLSRTNKATNRGRRPVVDDPFHEKLYCQKCGSRFVRHIGAKRAGKNKINYICQNRRKGQGCKVRGISISNVNEAFDRIGTSFLLDGIANHISYSKLSKRIEDESTKLTERRNAITAEIESLEEDSASTLRGIKEQLKGGSQAIIDMLSKDIEDNEKRIKELSSKRDKLNINSVLQLKEKVEAKRQLIDDINQHRDISKDERLKLLSHITVGDYELIVNFHFPTFEDEMLEFNSIFPMDEIHSSTSHKFSQSIRREHKAAREYWEEYDENEADYHNHKDGHYIEGKNISEDAKRIEKMLDDTIKPL